MVPARLSIVTIGVRDLAAQRGFYERLGWQRAQPDVGDFSMFALEGARLSLFPIGSLAADAHVAEDGPGRFRAVTCAIVVDRPEDIGPALEAAEAAGATVTKRAEKAEWGGWSGYFADPEGNLWELVWIPS